MEMMPIIQIGQKGPALLPKCIPVQQKGDQHYCHFPQFITAKESKTALYHHTSQHFNCVSIQYYDNLSPYPNILVSYYVIPTLMKKT